MCIYLVSCSSHNSASEAGPIYQGTIIKVDPRGVSAFDKKILGPAYVGEGIFLLHRGKLSQRKQYVPT